MYEERFGFTGRPFQLTPDPAFWYETATHRKAMAYLGYGLAQGEGFIVVTGDIGAGKTTLMGHLVDTIDPQALNAIKLVSTAIEADDLLRIVATALGVDPAALSKAQLLTAIERGLHAVARSGRRTLLLVDEAQALTVAALEELRMLSNFQLGGHALVQIVLMGQPEFRERLNGTDRLEQLRQRVIAIHHLDPMGADEVAAYVAHRLAVVGWSGTPDFTDEAHAALHHYSDGIPRRLNQLANRVLLHAGMDGAASIDGAMVRDVAEDVRADLPAVVPASIAPAAVAERPATIAVVPDAADEAPMPSWVVEPSFVPDPDPAVDVALAPRLDLVAPDEQIPSALDDEREQSIAPDWVAEAPLFEAADMAFSSEPDLAVVADVPVEPRPGFDDARIAALEERIEAQDVALRRVLTLLVDWVESDAPRAGLSPLRDAAA